MPGWGTVRAGNYGAAVGDPRRWPGARQLYRASGLSPAQYESAGRRRDGTISREGSVALRRALIDLGIGLWHADPAARRYGPGAAGPREEGRRHRLRDGAPRQQDRLRLGSGPDRLRPDPLGLTTPGGFLDRGHLRRAQERSTWSARSAARTNEVDRDEQRRTLGSEESPRKPEVT